jgi:hypothetical protein
MFICFLVTLRLILRLINKTNVMHTVFRYSKKLVIFGVPMLIIAAMILMSKSAIFRIHPNKLAFAITGDLLLTAPLIYFLLIRKTKIPNTTVVPFVILGVVVSSLILPLENQYYLNLFKVWILPIIEISVISFIFYKVRKAIQINKLKKNISTDFFTSLKHVCNEIFPKPLVIPFVTEVSVFYYGFIYWKKRHLNKNEFSYHKDSGTITLLIAILLIVGIEIFVIHQILLKWSELAAWILTILSIYSGIQIFGFIK